MAEAQPAPCCLPKYVQPLSSHGTNAATANICGDNGTGMPNESSTWPCHGARAGTDGPSLSIFINYWLPGQRLAPEISLPEAPRPPALLERRDSPPLTTARLPFRLPLRPQTVLAQRGPWGAGLGEEREANLTSAVT